MNNSMSGIREWVIQRITAVYMAFYIVLMFAYLASHPHLSYPVWKHLFSVFWVQVPSLIFLVCLMWHAWIGIWTVITDYVHQVVIRIALQLLVLLALFVYFFWGVEVIWGIHMVWVF